MCAYECCVSVREDVSVDGVPHMFSIMFLDKVISIEKMEDTSLLPNPIIVSIRSKMAFQFIELKDRDTLVENLLQRLREVNSSNPVHCNNIQNRNQVLNFCLYYYYYYYYELNIFIHWSIFLPCSGGCSWSSEANDSTLPHKKSLMKRC